MDARPHLRQHLRRDAAATIRPRRRPCGLKTMNTHTREVVKARYAVTGCFCLLLLALFVWRLAGDGFNRGWLFGAPDFAKGAPALDSFSEPSVGLAILKQKAAQLLLAYNENRNQVKASQSAPLQDGAATGTRAGPGSVSSSPGAFNRRAAPDVSALKDLLKLRAEVRDLDVDLDWELMGVYCRNDSCNEFLDCYLRLVQQVPRGYPGLAVWTWNALECARKCGRAEEVAGALHHLIRFHQNLPNAEAIRATLENWEAQNLAGREFTKR